MLAAILIFAATYLVIAIGTLPCYRLDCAVASLAPVAAAGLVLTMALIAVVFPKEFFTRQPLIVESRPDGRFHRALVYKSLFITAAVIVLFFAGQPVAKVAILGGALLLFTR